jgi:hypothetical protein
MSDTEDQSADIREAVRDALERHGVDVESLRAEPEPVSQEVQDASDQVAAQLEQQQYQQPEQPRQSRNSKGQFSKAADDQIDLPGPWPPTSWSKEAKEEWTKLPPSIQHAIAVRESQVEAGFRQHRERAESNREIESILAPRREGYQRHGFQSDAAAVNYLFEFSDALERDPAGTALRVMQSFSPAAIQQIRQALLGGSAPPAPPQQQPVNIQQQVDERVALQFARKTVEEFEQNAPEHYQDVKPLMQMLLERGQARDMQDAYDKAVWMHPQVRDAMLAKRDEMQRQKTVNKVINKAKAANASLNGAPYGAASAPAPRKSKGVFGDVFDDVAAAIAQHR